MLDAVIRRGPPSGPLPLRRLPMTQGAGGTVSTRPATVSTRPGSGPASSPTRRGQRGYAEPVLARVESLDAVAQGVTANEAVAMIGTGRTTLAILEVGARAPDDVAVVMGAAGGSARSWSVPSATLVRRWSVRREAARRPLVRRLGATAAVNYSVQGWQDAVRAAVGDRSVTLALDGVGGEIGRGALESLGIGGRIVMSGPRAAVDRAVGQ